MFRWFVWLGMDYPVWVPTVFTKNRWTAPTEWSGLIVSALSVSGLSGRRFSVRAGGIPASCAA